MRMRKILLMLLLLLILFGILSLIFPIFMTPSFAEETSTETVLFVTATQLYGRYTPSKTGIIEAVFDRGMPVRATGRWSKDWKWVEVYGGECDIVWCKAEYLTEILEPITVHNESEKKIKIRKHPGNGRVVGYVKPDQTLTITQVVLGWGKTRKGWIDLVFFSEVK